MYAISDRPVVSPRIFSHVHSRVELCEVMIAMAAHQLAPPTATHPAKRRMRRPFSLSLPPTELFEEV
jgi:hypothetical protein